jgi:broad specificity phosphatase PhoE
MSPKFIFVRHGEAAHNVAFKQDGETAFTDPKYKDAPLTEEGIKQAQKTALELQKVFILDIWSSPLTRCIQTSEELFEETTAQNCYFHDSLLERLGGGHICNERKLRVDLKERYTSWDYSFLPEIPVLWTERENETSLQRRMLAFVLLLAEMYRTAPESTHILIVSHADVIWSLTRKSLKNAEYVILSLDEILAASRGSESPGKQL